SGLERLVGFNLTPRRPPELNEYSGKLQKIQYPVWLHSRPLQEWTDRYRFRERIPSLLPSFSRVFNFSGMLRPLGQTSRQVTIVLCLVAGWGCSQRPKP